MRFLILLLVSWFSAAQLSAAERPNVLFAFADDWGCYSSIYARLAPGGISDLVSTPNFDRVAEEGVLFTRTFVNAPSCTPCRSSLLSGQYFWRTGRGAILQGAIWDESIPSYPLILREGGYHIGHTYKVWSPGTPADAPHGGREAAYVKRGRRFNQFSQFVSAQPDIEAAKQTLLDEVHGNFQDFLNSCPADQPFCYFFGPTNVHRKWIRGSGKALWGLDPDQLKGKLPAFLPDVPEIREDIADYLGEVQAFDAALGVILKELEESGKLDETLIIVSGDHGMPGMPHGKCNLYDFGTHVSLAARWPGKIPPGRVVQDFVELPDIAPTILEACGQTPPEVMTARSFLNVLTSPQQGQVDPARDAAVFGRERHVAGVREGFTPYPQRAIRTADYLYIRNFRPERWPMGEAPGHGRPDSPFPDREDLTENTFAAFGDMDAGPTKAWIIQQRNEPEVRPFFDMAFARRPADELYDLRSDPDQVHNVAGQAEYAAVQKQLSERLLTLLKETGDPRVTGDGMTFERSPFTDEYQRPNPRRNAPRARN